MTVTNAAAYGVTVTFNGTLIGELVDIAQSGMSAGVVDNTHQTTANGWKTHDISGFVEPGEYSLTILFDGTLPAIGTVGDLVVAWTPLSKTWTWVKAIFTSFDPTGALGQEMVASVKFKLSGKPTVS